MAEYIERKRAIVDACNSLELYPSEYAKLEDALNKIPAADVEPVKRGRWGKVYKSKVTVSDGYVSSCCDMWNERRTRYCPNCGARMDLPEQAEEAYRGDQ